MKRLQDNYIFSSQATTATSGAILNTQADTLVLQVSGTFTGLQLKIFGQADLSADAVQLSGFNQAIEIVSTISAVGVYTIPLSGITKYYAQITAISSGSVTVYSVTTEG